VTGGGGTGGAAGGSAPDRRPARRGLTQDELSEVLRRATELDSQSLPELSESRLDPAVVEAAAIEAGLSQAAVRRAIDEVLHGAQAPEVYGEKGLLPSSELVISRQVPGTVDAAEASVSQFLRRQLFARQRIFADGARWAPRGGWTADVRRRVDPGGRFVLKHVRRIDVTITEVSGADAVDVRFALDLSRLRSTHRAFLAGGVASGAAVVGVTGVVVGLDPVALLALPAAGGLAVGGHYVGRTTARNEAEWIHTAVAGMLDRLEHGGRATRQSLPGTRRRGARPANRAGEDGGEDEGHS
jgi:hypothetical protein